MRTWDIRNLQGPVTQLAGHTYAVRRVRYSPHHPNIIASASYDMSVCVWDTSIENSLLKRMDTHTEFVVGVDFSLFSEGLIASCGWDQMLHLWHM